VSNHSIMHPKNGKLTELLMSALNNMTIGNEELLAFIDETTGKDLQFSEDYKKENIGVFSDILLSGEGELVDTLLDINEIAGQE